MQEAATRQQNPSSAAPGWDPGLFAAYVKLAAGLVGDLAGICLLDGHGRVLGLQGAVDIPFLQRWLQELRWSGVVERQPAIKACMPGEWLTVLPLELENTVLLGVLCLHQSLPILPSHPARHATEIAQRVSPLLDCIRRQLGAGDPLPETATPLPESTAELEWLLQVSTRVRAAGQTPRALEGLLAAGAKRFGCAIGICEIFDQRLTVEHVPEPLPGVSGGVHPALRGLWTQTRRQFLATAAQRHEPTGSDETAGAHLSGGVDVPRCKILAVPVIAKSRRIIGAMGFLNPPDQPDFNRRHVMLARHLGRQAADAVDLKFDALTGLYAHAALEQISAVLAEEAGAAGCCLLYVDVDLMHVVNETHGFDRGDALLVRLADALSPPHLPVGARAARLSDDRFLVLLPGIDATAGRAIAQQIQAAVMRLDLGPTGESLEVSLSIGLGVWRPPDAPLDSAIAEAEKACATARRRGRGRIERYARTDAAMHGLRPDALAVVRWRSALKRDAVELSAQPLRPASLSGLSPGYRVAARLRDAAAGDPDHLLAADDQHPLRPLLDRWTLDHTVALLKEHRPSLDHRHSLDAVHVTLPLADESLANPDFIAHLGKVLRAAELPAGCLTVALAKPPTTRNFTRARELNDCLRAHGCRLALDDFNLGREMMLHVKHLDIARVGIDARDAMLPEMSLWIRTLITRARAQKLETVATGVDSLELATLLEQSGFDYLQGAAIGGPEPLVACLQSITLASRAPPRPACD
jgi:diguanylate cyclase (GGDEF)-like protein